MKSFFYNKSLILIDMIKHEVKISSKIYDKEYSLTLKKYYPNLLKNKDYVTFTSHYYAIRLMHLINFIKKGMKILDAGCGVGSESIICGILGAKVIGIDISKNRIETAKKRIKFYEKKLNKKLNIELYHKNIFELSDNYDIIWLNEAISHITPAHSFIRFSYKNLKKGGKLIIADRNNLNPYVYLYNKREQKKMGSVYITKKDPITGKSIPYAVERCFTLNKLKELLSDHFKIVKLTAFGYYPFFFFKRFKQFCIKSEQIIRKIPFMKSISGGYVIVSIKIN